MNHGLASPSPTQIRQDVRQLARLRRYDQRSLKERRIEDNDNNVRQSPEVDVYRSQMISSRVGRALTLAPAVFVALWCVLVAQSAMAQSTIFNIPSTDTVDKGKGYVEFDFLPQAPGPDEGASIIIYNPRLIVGLPHDAEVGVNFPIYHNSDCDPSNLAYIQPNIKWKFYQERRRWAWRRVPAWS